jgi:hypothetical protein
MRRKSNKTRLGQFGDYWLSKNPDRNKATDSWCRTWYDPRSQQSRRESLGTADFADASKLLAQWVIENDKPESETRTDKVLINSILTSYWDEHGKNLPSARTIQNSIRYWSEFWGDDTVADIKPHKQRVDWQSVLCRADHRRGALNQTPQLCGGCGAVGPG